MSIYYFTYGGVFSTGEWHTYNVSVPTYIRYLSFDNSEFVGAELSGSAVDFEAIGAWVFGVLSNLPRELILPASRIPMYRFDLAVMCRGSYSMMSNLD